MPTRSRVTDPHPIGGKVEQGCTSTVRVVPVGFYKPLIKNNIFKLARFLLYTVTTLSRINLELEHENID